ncbi:MAG: hypothetical protein IH874_04020 [Candidatus Dadabacteria bacterium]|nr:hypothetical protein [Candidatus Dadabacteria bacterium]
MTKINCSGKPGDVWKQIAIIALTVVVTGAGAWFGFASDRVSGGEVDKLIDVKYSSMEKDQKYIKEKVSKNETNIEEIRKDLVDIKVGLAVQTMILKEIKEAVK